MPHEITQTDATLSVREMPWMGLLDGQVHVLQDNPTRAEAQALVHPWEPIETAAYKRVPVITAEGVSTEYQEIEGSKVIERSDNGYTLGVVNDTYGVVTNTEMWDVAEAVGNVGTDIEIETAGSLSGGRQVWLLMRMAEPFQIVGDPRGETLAFLAIQNRHDATGSFRAQAINTRIVCANTSAAADVEAKRNGYEFTFRHSKNVGARMDEAKAAVAMWREGVAVWQTAMEALAATPITEAQRQLFIEQFQPMPARHLITDRVAGNVEMARAALKSILDGPTSEGIDLTAYGLYQAGIEYAAHYRAVRGADERSRMESYFRRNMLNDDGLRRSTLRLAQEVALASV